MRKRRYQKGCPFVLSVKVKELNGGTVWKELTELNTSSIDECFQQMAEMLKKKFG